MRMRSRSNSVTTVRKRSFARCHGAAHPAHLPELSPDFSANQPLASWQRWALFVGFLALTLSLYLAPRTALAALFAVLALPFLCVVLLRLSALIVLLQGRPEGDSDKALPEEALPTYSVLVPLYDEAEIIPDLLKALGKIDYPRDKLDIQLVVESADPKTLAALLDVSLPEHCRINVVPTSPPKTKPHALNHALQSAKGDVVVVYDAEDVPEPDQLRRAAALLAGDPEIGCVQASLNIYNPAESFLTRQFTIEYTALFDCVLPTLQRLKFPVPLGGTSNHFPSRVLAELGGWDAYNVTEDADLGICLARAGYRVEMLRSTTWEEAPRTFNIWLCQRTRWLKGWMQTYLVHMRRPRQLLEDLGARGFLGLQVLMGGVLLSTLVHPWFYVVALVDVLSGAGFMSSEAMTGTAIWSLALFNLLAGYGVGLALGWSAVRARGWRSLSWSSLSMPLYWLLISFAAYRGLYQLVSRPFYWEKTAHRARLDQDAIAPISHR